MLSPTFIFKVLQEIIFNQHFGGLLKILPQEEREQKKVTKTKYIYIASRIKGTRRLSR